MATYILMLTLDSEGRSRAAANPDGLIEAEAAAASEGVRCFGLYAVLGEYDFVALAEAPDNEAIARFSLEFGARAGAQIQTLPAIPVGLLSERAPGPSGDVAAGVNEPGG